MPAPEPVQPSAAPALDVEPIKQWLALDWIYVVTRETLWSTVELLVGEVQRQRVEIARLRALQESKT